MNLKIKIGQPEPETYPNSYFVAVRTMSLKGEEHTILFGPFHRHYDEMHMASLIGTLNRMVEQFPGPLTITDTYENVEGFLAWFDSGYLNEQEFFNEYPDFEGEFEEYAEIANIARLYGGKADLWPNDPATDYTTSARYTDYTVSYYDENMQKFSATAILED